MSVARFSQQAPQKPQSYESQMLRRDCYLFCRNMALYTQYIVYLTVLTTREIVTFIFTRENTHYEPPALPNKNVTARAQQRQKTLLLSHFWNDVAKLAIQIRAIWLYILCAWWKSTSKRAKRSLNWDNQSRLPSSFTTHSRQCRLCRTHRSLISAPHLSCFLQAPWPLYANFAERFYHS